MFHNFVQFFVFLTTKDTFRQIIVAKCEDSPIMVGTSNERNEE